MNEARQEGTTRHGRSTPRPVVASTFLTLDGYMVGRDEDMSWAIEGFDREMQDDIAEHMSVEADAFVFGRITYEIFAGYWPTAVPYEADDDVSPAAGREDPRIIDALNHCSKTVFSTTLGEPSWAHTRVTRDDPAVGVRRLKREPGRAISIQGSASIVQALGAADLIDEYRLYVHPVLLGGGKPLFTNDGARRDLDLVDAKRYSNGVLRLRFSRRGSGD